jgi:hypothetical protein
MFVMPSNYICNVVMSFARLRTPTVISMWEFLITDVPQYM